MASDFDMPLGSRQPPAKSRDGMNTSTGQDRLTISIISHGHGEMVEELLSDLDDAALVSTLRIIVTYNVPEKQLDTGRFSRLDIVVVANKRPQGYGKNHKNAFRYCSTPWFAVLNPDLRMPKEPFSSLVGKSARYPNVGVVCPLIVNSAGQLQDFVRSNLTPLSLLRRRLGGDQAISPTAPAERGRTFYWFAGMCMLFQAEAFRRIGGFDERFFLYCEDYDICARLYSAGYSLLVDPETHVIHDAQRSSRHSLRYFCWHLSSLTKVWCSRAFWRLTLGN
jgi:hypothetical protein